MPRKSDKRERLIDSAMSLMFKQGFNLTTLADIAQEADVPLGNVYYYFKTKESIGDAVIAHCVAELNQKLLDYDALGSASERLSAFARDSVSDRDFLLRYGDKFGSLCQELAKQGGQLATASANLMRQSINWVTQQYCQLGCDQADAETRAIRYMAKLQGMTLLAATFSKSELLDELMAWVDTTANTSTMSTTEERVEAYA